VASHQSEDAQIPPVLDRRISARARSVPASKIRRMFNLAEPMADVVSLAIGQPDFPTPAHIVAAAKAAMDRGHTRYTHGLGIPELRAAIAEKVRGRNGLTVDADCVAVTVGAMEGLILTLLATLDAGDEVLIPNPGYTNFMGQVLMVGATPISYPVVPPDFHIDIAALRGSITERTRVIILCTPANPTGAVLSLDNLQEVAAVAREHDLLVLSDETYEALVYDGHHVSIGGLPGMLDSTVSVFSFSKAYAMTGWRIGYVVAPHDLIQTMSVLQENVVSCASSVSQYAALAALEGPQTCVQEMLDIYNQRRHYMVDALNQMDGVQCPMPSGAFYAFPDISQLSASSDALADRLLRQAHVATVPGTAFNTRGEGFLRLSYATSMDTLQEAMERLHAGIQPIHDANLAGHDRLHSGEGGSYQPV